MVRRRFLFNELLGIFMLNWTKNLCHRYFTRGLPSSLVMGDFHILYKIAYTWLARLIFLLQSFQDFGNFFTFFIYHLFYSFFLCSLAGRSSLNDFPGIVLSEMLLISMAPESTERMYEYNYFDKLLLSKIIVVKKNSASDYRVFPAYDLSCYHRDCISKR